MEMDKKLRAIFAQIKENHCLETISDSEFDIYDSGEEQRCFILSDETISSGTQLFKVINHNNQNIRFLAVDKCGSPYKPVVVLQINDFCDILPRKNTESTE